MSRSTPAPRWLPSPARWVAAAGALVVVAACGAAGAHVLSGRDPLGGVTVDGVEVTEGTLSQVVADRAAHLLARTVEVRVGGRRIGEARLGDLGVRVDEPTVVALAEAQRGRGAWGRAADALSPRPPVDVPLRTIVDEPTLAAVVDRVKEHEDRPPTSARLDLDHHTVVEGAPGSYVDEDGAIAALRRVVRDAEHAPEGSPMRLDVPIAALPPHVTSAFVRSLDVGAVLSSYETYFSRHGEQERRGENIDVAASKLDGLVLLPDELVSFNRVVGARSEENGFRKSWEIFKGEMKEGIGGGTCQVASTLHATAFFAGLEILERLPHSRPSAYIPIGLDATVVYPVVDMKLRNPYPFPVVLHATVLGNKLRMELLGKERPARVSFTRELVRVYAYKRKVEEKEGLHGRHVILKQHGLRGFRVKRKRELVFAGGKKREEETIDLYPPTSEVYEVPPGFDESLLPPLPADDVSEDLADQGDGAVASLPSPAPAGATLASVAAPSAAPEPGALPVGPADPTAPTSAPTSQAAAAADLIVETGRGLHPLSAAQVSPPRKLTIRR